MDKKITMKKNENTKNTNKSDIRFIMVDLMLLFIFSEKVKVFEITGSNLILLLLFYLITIISEKFQITETEELCTYAINLLVCFVFGAILVILGMNVNAVLAAALCAKVLRRLNQF